MTPCFVIPCAVGLIAGAFLGVHPAKLAVGFGLFLVALVEISVCA